MTGTVTGLTDVVEAAHATVTRPLGRSVRTRGLTGLVYRIVRAVTRGVGHALDAVLPASASGTTDALPRGGPARDAVVAALNGAFGDTLAAQGNPLATPMHLRHGGRTLDLGDIAASVPAPSDVVLVRVHGICMHDGQWGGDGHDPAATLAEGLGATLVSLRYNSGRHISENGRDFAGLLETLVAAWPREVRRLVIVGHSMGGLVARSAFAVATEAGHTWPARDVSLAMLGSPHHGAPLERIGNRVDALLGATRYSAPFARLGQIRSAGVTDLRFGTVRDEDWADHDRFERGPDRRRPLPLPEGVACYVVAATTGDGHGGRRDQTMGDGLVPLDSALGRHPDPAHDLGVPADRQWVAAGMTHFDLIRRPEVTARLLAWLVPPRGATPAI